MNIALKLTFLRIIFVPLFLIFILINSWITRLIALFIFILGGITDTADGIIARRKNIVTKIGISFDPLADKLLITTALISLLGFKELNIPSWTVTVIVIRDYIISWVRSLNYDQPIPADKTAKIKTILQNVVIICIILILTFENQIRSFGIDKYVIKIFPCWSMIVTAVFTLISGIVYIVKYRTFIYGQFK